MHLFCYAASTFGRIVGAARQIPTIIHDFDTQIYFPYPLYLKVLDRLLAAKTAGAFAASSFCRDYMRDVRKVPGERINILYHAIPDYVLRDAARADGAAERAKLGWPADAFIFGCITKLGPERGNETLLKAFRRVADEIPHARLALVYKPTLYHRVPKEYEHIPWIRDVHAMRASLERQVAELQLGDRVYLAETEGSVLPYYAASDVLVAPFENERFSSVNLVEGLAYGKAFVGTDIGEAHEIHAQHGVGKMAPPGDADALASAMIDGREAAAAARAVERARARRRGLLHCPRDHGAVRAALRVPRPQGRTTNGLRATPLLLGSSNRIDDVGPPGFERARVSEPRAQDAAAADLWLRRWDVASLDRASSVASDARDGIVGGGVGKSADRDHRSRG